MGWKCCNAVSVVGGWGRVRWLLDGWGLLRSRDCSSKGWGKCCEKGWIWRDVRGVGGDCGLFIRTTNYMVANAGCAVRMYIGRGWGAKGVAGAAPDVGGG